MTEVAFHFNAPDKLAYAANDTRYLETIADLLLRELRRRGREEWLEETCAALVLKTGEIAEEADPDEVWRIKGLKDLRRDQLALVRALRVRISGMAMPAYMLDIPGGFGKVPLESDHAQKTETGWRIRDLRGNWHDYLG